MSRPLVKVFVKKGCGLPEYKTPYSAGADLRACIDEPITIPPHGRALIPTGLHIELPQGYEAQIRPRSGLALKYGITVLNSVGTIDEDDTMLSVARDDTARLLLVFKLDEKKIEDKNVLEIQVFLDKEPIDTIHLEGVAKPQLANRLFPDNEKIWVVIYANPFYNNGFEWTMMLPEEY